MDIIRPIFSAKDLAQMPDDGKRYEVLEGDLAVSPSPNRKHQRCVLQLTRFFEKVEDAEYGQVFPAPFDVILDHHNVVEPDLLFICQDRLHIVTDANIQGPPDVVVEVLSPSTRDRDPGVKVHLYARFGVREYWIVDPDNQTLTMYRLTADGYQLWGPYFPHETVTSPLFPDYPLSVTALFR